jgi:hypothetical protein
MLLPSVEVSGAPLSGESIACHRMDQPDAKQAAKIGAEFDGLGSDRRRNASVSGRRHPDTDVPI